MFLAEQFRFKNSSWHRLAFVPICICLLLSTPNLWAKKPALPNTDSLLAATVQLPADKQIQLLVPAWEVHAAYSVANAAPLLERIRQLQPSVQATDSKIMILRVFALAAYYRNKFREAFNYCTEGFKLISQNLSDNKLHEALILFVRGQIYMARGNLANALKDFNDARQIIQSLKDVQKDILINELRAKIYIQQGIIARMSNEFQKAEQYFLYARKLFNQNKMFMEVALADVYVADIMTLNNNLTQAYFLLNSSMKTFLTYKCYHYQALTYFLLGNLSMSKKKPQEAYDYYSKSILIDKANEKSVSLQTYYVQAANALGKAGNYQVAFQYLNEAIKNAKEAGNNLALKAAYDTEARLYEALGNYRAAYQSRQLADIYQDSVFNEQVPIELARSMTESAIDSLHARQKANQLEMEAQKKQIVVVLVFAIFAIVALLYILHLRISEKNAQKAKDLAIEELTQKKQSLDKALLEIKNTQKQYAQSEKLAALGQLVGGIAHEILNPMNYIKIGNQQLVKSIRTLTEVNEQYRKALYELQPEHPLLSEQQQKKITEIKNNIDEFLTIIQSGIDKILRIIQSMRQLKPHDFQYKDIHQTIEHALTILEAQYSEIAVVRNYNKQCPQVRADHTQLEQVFSNILNNAFQAIRMAERRDGKLIIETDFFKSERDNGKVFVIVDIQDNGIGMSEEVRQQIYQPFFSTKGVGAGTGLGLYITKQILDFHRAKVDVSSEVGKGTNFIIAIPAD